MGASSPRGRGQGTLKEEVAGKTSLEQRVYNGLNGVQEYHLHWTGIKVGLDRRKEGWGRWILELQG